MGASQSKRWMECPGSIRELKKIPEYLRSKGSIYAQEGTAAHALLEKCLREKKNARKFRGYSIQVNDAGQATIYDPSIDVAQEEDKSLFYVSVGMCEAVQVCIDVVKEELDRLGNKAKLDIESRVYPIEGDNDIYGTADAIISLWGEEIVVIDFKYGSGISVEIEDNSQMRFYALGAAQSIDFIFEKIKVIIVQPRSFHDDGQVRSETLTRKQIKSWGRELQKSISRTKEPDAPLKAGEWCRFCDATTFCKAQEKLVSKVACMDFKDDPETTLGVELSEVNEKLKWIPALEAFIKQVKATAWQLKTEEPEQLPDFKFVEGRSNRKFQEGLSPKKILRILEREFGLDEEALFSEPVLKSPAQIEKLVPKKRRILLNDKLFYKPKGKISLVSIDDTREETDNKAFSNFEDFE